MSAVPSQTMTMPSTTISGMPTEKMFSCGAARVMMPKAMLTTSSAVMAGSTSRMPAPMTQPSRPATCQKCSTLRVSPTGRVTKLSARISNTTRWPFMARNSSVTSMVKNWPMTGAEAPLTGSIMDAKLRPAWVEMICPATTKTWKNSCRLNPITAPMRICSTISGSAWGLMASTCGIGGRVGTSTRLRARARYIRTRTGTRVVPMIGMVISSAAMRNSGNRKLPTQPPIWASLRASMG